MSLAREIYLLTIDFPKSEEFGLKAQLRRAAVSIPSNLAEGHGRYLPGEMKNYLRYARGSACELSTQIQLSAQLELISAEDAGRIETRVRSILGMLTSFLKALNARPTTR